jgi:hypothetical protein
MDEIKGGIKNKFRSNVIDDKVWYKIRYKIFSNVWFNVTPNIIKVRLFQRWV